MNALHALLAEKKVLVAAHRGVAGADILEMDLFKSADGELFIFHTGKEPFQLDRHIDITKLSSAQIRQLRLVNVDFNETAFGLNTFDEVLEQFKNRCILK